MSAEDLVILSRRIIADFPEFYAYFKETEFTWNDITQPNRNPLLDAGHRRRRAEDRAHRGRRLRAGRLGGAGRPAHRLRGERARERLRARGGDRVDREVGLRLLRHGEVLRRGRGRHRGRGLARRARDGAAGRARRRCRCWCRARPAPGVAAQVVYAGPVEAPIAAGQKLGELRVEVPGSGTASFDLVAGADVPRGGLLTRINAAARLTRDRAIGLLPGPRLTGHAARTLHQLRGHRRLGQVDPGAGAGRPPARRRRHGGRDARAGRRPGCRGDPRAAWCAATPAAGRPRPRSCSSPPPAATISSGPSARRSPAATPCSATASPNSTRVYQGVARADLRGMVDALHAAGDRRRAGPDADPRPRPGARAPPAAPPAAATRTASSASGRRSRRGCGRASSRSPPSSPTAAGVVPAEGEPQRSPRGWRRSPRRDRRAAGPFNSDRKSCI